MTNQRAGRADVGGGRSNEALVLVQAVVEVVSHLDEQGTMDTE